MDNALAERMIRVLEERPEVHSQMTWVTPHKITVEDMLTAFHSETVYPKVMGCLAGWICAFTLPRNYIMLAEGNYRTRTHLLGWTGSIQEHAQKRLGISTVNAQWLFHPCTPRADIIRGLRWLQEHPDSVLRLREWEYSSSEPEDVIGSRNQIASIYETLTRRILGRQRNLEDRPTQSV